MAALTSSDICDKLAALDTLSGDLDHDFDTAAMEAVAGVEGAGAKALSINQRIERLAVDRAILGRALTRAQRAEADARARSDAERRQQHRDQGRLSALALIECADRVDGLVDDLVAAMADMRARWQSVRASMQAAGEPINFASVGQQDLCRHVTDRLAIVSQGVRYDATERRAGHWARVGWRDLIGGSDV
jgi:hypothetical protein